jgi:two-component system, response regulator PdtaR
MRVALPSTGHDDSRLFWEEDAMRAMVVEADTLSALRMSEALTTAGFNIVGPARSSGEALLLARLESPDVVLLGMDLEVSGAGQRLADTLERELQVPSVVRQEHADLDAKTQGEDLIRLVHERRRRRS